MAFQGDSIFWVEVEKIVPNPFQPRREFNEAKLKELSESIQMYGILQPLTVTRKEIHGDDGAFYSEYELIAGERRLRASKLAGLGQVPVIIREGENSEQEKLELAIIENLQREDLNAVDRALAFRQLADVFSLSHKQVAQKVGRSREYVSNTLRLLMLPEYMLDSLKVGDISEGHARTLLMLNDRPEELDTVYREILLKKLSVREVERIARKIATDKVRKKIWEGTDPELIEMEKKFTESLGTRVQIAKTDYGGKITIDYFSDEDLSVLLERLKKERSEASVSSASAVDAVTDEMEESVKEEKEVLNSIIENTPLEESAETNVVEGEYVDVPQSREQRIPSIDDQSVPSVLDSAETVSEQVESIPEADKEIVTHAPATEETSYIQNTNQSVPVPPSVQQVQDPAGSASPVSNHEVQTPPALQPDPISHLTSEPVSEMVEESQTSDPIANTPVREESVDTSSFSIENDKQEKNEDDSGLYDIKNFGI